MSDKPVSDDDMIEGQKIAEAMAERYPNEINSHKGRLFRCLVVMVAALSRDKREACAQIALAIDSGRGNEKEIARAIRERAAITAGNHDTVITQDK